MKQRRERLARVRKAAGHTQESLADLLRLDRSTVVRWERTETEPQPWLRPRLARALGISPARLDELLTDIVTVEKTESDDRLATVLSGHARVDVATARALHDQVRRIDRDYETAPSASLLAAAGQCHASLLHLLAGTSGEGVRQELQTALAASASLMSQLVWDASGRRDGVTTLGYCDRAIAAAEASQQPAAKANAELRRSYVALYGLHPARDPRAGLNDAETAIASSQGVSHALTGLATLHAAEALAMQGEYRMCERAIGEAERHFDRVNADDVGARYFSPTQFGRLSGSCYLFLGSPERAEPSLSKTAQALGAWHKTRSLVLGNLALAYLRQRKLDEAIATLHDAIDALEQARGAGGMTVVFGAARELYPWRQTPAVQEVNDRLLALMTKA